MGVYNSLAILSYFLVASSCQCCGKQISFFIDSREVIHRNLAHEDSETPYSSYWATTCEYEDSYSKTGWGVFECKINPTIDRKITAYMTGYSEGSLTKRRIEQHWNNTIGDYCQSQSESLSCQKVYKFLDANLKWMQTMIKKNPNDSYWQEVEYILLQLQGLIDGYELSVKYNPELRIEPFGLLLLQLAGDLAEIETALGVEERLYDRVIGSGSCSGLVKIVSNSHVRELYTSHVTWTMYNMMLRFVKRFDFPGHTEVFSGYPGMLFSGDDFYVLSSGLVTMETTNGNYNSKLWKNVQPETVLEWIRTMISNRHAKDGRGWCETFQQHNSGTYNNQWMVVDYKKFNSKSQDQILYVLEQLPGEVQYTDMTKLLLVTSYWSSYNIPYFPKIYNDSGMPDLVKKYGDYYTHNKNPRASIFSRDHKKVNDLESLVKLMRYNNFKVDPLAKCNCTPPYSASNAIAARCDLNDPNGTYPNPVLKQRNHGATDVKATSSTLAKSLSLVAECGPTHDQQPIFQWSKSPYANSPHKGHVDIFDFKPELFNWDK